MDAALTLDGLDEDAAGLGSDGRSKRVGVVEPGERHRGQQRLERGPLRRLAGHGERAERAAVERVLERHDAWFPGRLPCPLERRLDGLRARVAEERRRAAEAVGEAGRE